MRCEDAVAFLETTVGDTVAPAEVGLDAAARAALVEHLAGCAACVAVRDEIRGGADALAALLAPPAGVPADPAADARLADAVLARVAPAPRRIPASRLWLRAAGVLVACAAGTAAWRALHGPGGTAGTDAPPAPGPGPVADYRLAPPHVADYAGPRFADVTDRAGIAKSDHTGREGTKDWMVETIGHGAAAFDMDGDGDLDLFVPDGNRLSPEERVADTWRLYRNDGGLRFTDVTRDSGLETDAWGSGAVAGDVDADGRPDLFVPCFGRNRLYRNLGGGRFLETTDDGGVAGTEDEWSTAAAMGDLDGDGDLDLYVANYADMRRFMSEAGGPRTCKWRGLDVACGPQPLDPQKDRLYLNRGDGTFEDVSAERLPPFRRYSFQPVIVDLDGDGALDVYVAADAQPNVLLRNDGTARFRDVAVEGGAATNVDGKEQAGMGVASGDLDGDGRPDLFVTNFSHESNCLYRAVGGPGRPLFGDATRATGLERPSYFTLGWGASLADLDSDGDLDLAYANGHLYPGVDRGATDTTYAQHAALFENDGTGRLREVSSDAGDVAVPRVHRGLLVADLDDDGHLDLFLTVLNGRAVVLRNDGRGAGQSVRLVLRRRDGRTEAAGARVTAKVVAPGAPPRTIVRDLLLGSSFGSSEDPRVHLGLGTAGAVESFSVRWPGGAEESFGALPREGVVEVVEGRREVRRLR
jgi:hypothetical protein